MIKKILEYNNVEVKLDSDLKILDLSLTINQGDFILFPLTVYPFLSFLLFSFTLFYFPFLFFSIFFLFFTFVCFSLIFFDFL